VKTFKQIVYIFLNVLIVPSESGMVPENWLS
jgi:hypothetical protein